MYDRRDLSGRSRGKQGVPSDPGHHKRRQKRTKKDLAFPKTGYWPPIQARRKQLRRDASALSLETTGRPLRGRQWKRWYKAQQREERALFNARKRPS